ncbi:MAG TPA: TolC family protein, partial [Gammaproteobacteria bacterium]|nr:TolC family protein [Gammaproteobacteria bacterium]
MRTSIRYRAIVCGLMLGAHLGATGAAELPEPLHLQQAIAYALQNNFAVQEAAARVRRRGGAVTHAGRIVPSNPRVNVWAGPRNTRGHLSTDIRLMISQELWTAGKRGLGVESARAGRRAAQDQLEFLRMTTAARARRAFLDVLKAQESVRTARQVLHLARELQRFVQQRLKAGASTRLDLNTAVIATGKARAQLALAKGELGHARL